LNGGNSDNGGLANVNCNEVNNHWNNRAVRPLGVSHKTRLNCAVCVFQPATDHPADLLQFFFKRNIFFLVNNPGIIS